MKNIAVIAAALVLPALAACGGGNPEVEQKLLTEGFTEATAEQLSSMELTENEVEQLARARKGGLDDAAAVDMVKSLHEKELRFDLAPDMEVLVRQGFSATALTELVEMGAIPRWTDDVRAMKTAGVEDVAIVEIAGVRFRKHEEVLSGGEYARMKRFGLSDAGLLKFVRKGGTPQQAQELALALQMGKSEQEALREVGM